MADEKTIEQIRASTAETMDLYVRSVSEHKILEDLGGPLEDLAAQVAAALLRQRSDITTTVRDLIEKVGALEQLLGLIRIRGDERSVVHVTARGPDGKVIGEWDTSEDGEHRPAKVTR